MQYPTLQHNNKLSTVKNQLIANYTSRNSGKLITYTQKAVAWLTSNSIFNLTNFNFLSVELSEIAATNCSPPVENKIENMSCIGVNYKDQQVEFQVVFFNQAYEPVPLFSPFQGNNCVKVSKYNSLNVAIATNYEFPVKFKAVHLSTQGISPITSKYICKQELFKDKAMRIQKLYGLYGSSLYKYIYIMGNIPLIEGNTTNPLVEGSLTITIVEKFDRGNVLATVQTAPFIYSTPSVKTTRVKAVAQRRKNHRQASRRLRGQHQRSHNVGQSGSGAVPDYEFCDILSSRVFE